MGFLYLTACQSGARVIIGKERGDIAQLVERTDRTREVRGSNPLVSNFMKPNNDAPHMVPRSFAR